jgi:hypothetical protein
MSEDPKAAWGQGSGGISYDPSFLPEAVTTTDQYLRALLIELRVLNRTLKDLDRQLKQAKRAK